MAGSVVGKGARVPKHYVTRLAAALGTGQGAERLYDAYGPGLYEYSWAMLADPVEAAGALTDTVLVATAHADALGDPADLTAWVYALTRAECLRRIPQPPRAWPGAMSGLRVSGGAAGAGAGGGAASGWASGPYAAGPYAVGETDDVLTMLVARALANLGPADRELLELSVRHRLSARQLARVLGLAEHEAERLAESAVTRFDQNLSTLFMAASGRLAVPREFLTDRPPLRVLLDLLPPARPPADLSVNITAACTDPALSHYRDLVARRALPLTPTGFPRAPRPATAGPPTPDPISGAPAGPHVVPHPRPAPFTGASGGPATPSDPATGPGWRAATGAGGTPPADPAFRSRGAFQPRDAGTESAEPGTAAMPLGAPVAPPGAGTAGPRPPGGRPTIEPVAGDIITPEAISLARTDAPSEASPPSAAPRRVPGARRDGQDPAPPTPAASPLDAEDGEFGGPAEPPTRRARRRTRRSERHRGVRREGRGEGRGGERGEGRRGEGRADRHGGEREGDRREGHAEQRREDQGRARGVGRGRGSGDDPAERRARDGQGGRVARVEAEAEVAGGDQAGRAMAAAGGGLGRVECAEDSYADGEEPAAAVGGGRGGGPGGRSGLEERRAWRRGSLVRRFWRWVGVVMAVAAVAAGAWAGQRIMVSFAAVVPRVAPSATASAGGNGVMPTEPGMSPSHGTKPPARPAETGAPVATSRHSPRPAHGHRHPRPSRHSTRPVPVGPLKPSPSHHHSTTPTHTPTHTPTPPQTPHHPDQ